MATISFNNYFKSVLGKGIDYDGMYGNQCVDLANDYSQKVLGIKLPMAGIQYARHLWEKFENYSVLKTNFDKIANTPDFVPQKGDIVIWSSAIGGGNTGHIAVATGKGDTHKFKTYDQNWGSKTVKEVEHNYQAVYGVLRKKVKTLTLTVNTSILPLRLREKASTTAKVITTMPKGSKVTKLGSSGGFYKIKYKTYTGYADKRYLK